MDTKTALQVRRYIGKRIAHARKLRDDNQTQFAAALSDYLDDEWTRDQVTNLETGRKRIDVELLCAIAYVQERPVTWYFADAPSSLAEVIPGYLSRQRHRLSTLVPHTSHLAPSSPLPAAA